MNKVAITRTQWHPVCQRSDLVADSGVCALVGNRQIALFFIPDQQPQLYAIDNWDCIAKANIISRGLTAEIDDRITVASPLYKHHFCLREGICLEDNAVQLAVYPAAFDGDTVCIAID